MDPYLLQRKYIFRILIFKLIATQSSDRSPFTGGGNRTHVAVPKNLLTTEALYHSATEVLIEFDKYFGSRVV